MKLRERFIEPYITVGRIVGATVAFVSLGGLLVALYRRDENAALPLWGWFLAAVLVVVAIVAAFLVGRSRRIAPSRADQLAGELEVSNGYLFLVEDFMSTFREVVVSGDPRVAAERLPRLRDLLFDAVVQGVNTRPGEHIRCAHFVPLTEEGREPVLVAQASRGHTDGVKELRLPCDATSIAGLALLNGEPVYVADASTDKRVFKPPVAGRHPVVTLFCLPTFPFSVSADAPTGVLSVTSNKPDAFSDADQNFISLCASLIGLLGLAGGIFAGLDAIRKGLERFAQKPPRLDPPSGESSTLQ